MFWCGNIDSIQDSHRYTPARLKYPLGRELCKPKECDVAPPSLDVGSLATGSSDVGSAGLESEVF